MRKSFEYVKKMKFGIIGDYGLIKNYIAACKDLEIDYEIIDIFQIIGFIMLRNQMWMGF